MDSLRKWMTSEAYQRIILSFSRTSLPLDMMFHRPNWRNRRGTEAVLPRSHNCSCIGLSIINVSIWKIPQCCEIWCYSPGNPSVDYLVCMQNTSRTAIQILCSVFGWAPSYSSKKILTVQFRMSGCTFAGSSWAFFAVHRFYPIGTLTVGYIYKFWNLL